MVTERTKNTVKIMPLGFFYCCCFAISCTLRDSDNQIKSTSSDIFLFNLGHDSRAQISANLDAINLCKPKIIAINAIFENVSQTKSDSMLQASIKSANNIILVSNIVDGEIISSDSAFVSRSQAQGFLDYGDGMQTISKHKLFESVEDQLLWSFPYTIVVHYDFDTGKKIMEGMLANQFYDLDVSNRKKFEIISLDKSNRCDCSKIKDKIILIGYLGPELNEDTYSSILDEKGTKTYNTIIIAQMVNDILSNNLTKSKD